jgi:Beta-galactosidase
MSRTPRIILPIALAALMIAVVATPAQAAKRKVPFGFFGTVLPPEMTYSGYVSESSLDQQMALMARSGVETARVTLGWDDVEPARGVFDFRVLDRNVAAAARHGIQVLVNVTATPGWNSPRPTDPFSWRLPPKDPNAMATTMKALVARYGPKGSLWAQNPSLPRVPVRQWQIWNEQTAPWHWQARRWAQGYVRVLKAAYRGVHSSDRGAKVVAGSLVAATARYAPWDEMRDLYRAGGKGAFDVISVHPFTNNARSVRGTVSQTLEIVKRVRAQMRRHGDRRKPIILTEVTWPASKGKVPKAALIGLETTPGGQVARLKAAYRGLASARRKLRITQAYWYTWATQYQAIGAPSVMSFRFAGLTRLRDGVFTPMPVLRTYANLAASYEGCRKSSNARRCR